MAYSNDILTITASIVSELTTLLPKASVHYSDNVISVSVGSTVRTVEVLSVESNYIRTDNVLECEGEAVTFNHDITLPLENFYPFK